MSSSPPRYNFSIHLFHLLKDSDPPPPLSHASEIQSWASHAALYRVKAHSPLGSVSMQRSKYSVMILPSSSSARGGSILLLYLSQYLSRKRWASPPISLCCPGSITIISITSRSPRLLSAHQLGCSPGYNVLIDHSQPAFIGSISPISLVS